MTHRQPGRLLADERQQLGHRLEPLPMCVSERETPVQVRFRLRSPRDRAQENELARTPRLQLLQPVTRVDATVVADLDEADDVSLGEVNHEHSSPVRTVCEQREIRLGQRLRSSLIFTVNSPAVPRTTLPHVYVPRY